MKSFETAGQRVVEKENDNEGSLEEIKDTLFDQYMRQQLVEDFFGELTDFINEEQIEAMRAALSTYDDEEIYATLSLPHELRERKFEEFSNKIEQGADPSELMRELAEISIRHQFGIGYHTSPYEIKPDQAGRWSIKGTEQDHRDGDRVMAYYSKKYRHLFKKKAPQFVYIVRTEPHTHKTDGNWSRASELSIIAKVPFADVFEYVEKTSREVEKRNGTAH